MSPFLRTEGILLHKFPFQNSGLIITWLTKEYGRIKTIAQGALRPGSPYQGTLDLYYQCEIQFVQKKRGEIEQLKEAELREPHLHLRRDYSLLQTICYFAEIIELVTEPRTPIPEYYDLMSKALLYLNTRELHPKVIERFEKKALEIAGLTSSRNSDFEQILHQHGYRIPKNRSTIALWISKNSGQ